jgi:hypothetical protein
MSRKRRRTQWSVFPLAGWLFTDLLLAMMMLFLVSGTVGVPNPGPVTKTPTPPSVVCGIDPAYHTALVTVSDPEGLRGQTASALNSFFSDVEHNHVLQNDSGRVAGVVEVFGGSPNVSDGVNFAAGAILSLHNHANGQFIFSPRTVYFKPLWDGTIESNQVRIYVFYYILAASCGS